MAISRASPLATPPGIVGDDGAEADQVRQHDRTDRRRIGVSRQPVQHGDPEERPAQQPQQGDQFGGGIRRDRSTAELQRNGHQRQAHCRQIDGGGRENRFSRHLTVSGRRTARTLPLLPPPQ